MVPVGEDRQLSIPLDGSFCCKNFKETDYVNIIYLRKKKIFN